MGEEGDPPIPHHLFPGGGHPPPIIFSKGGHAPLLVCGEVRGTLPPIVSEMDFGRLRDPGLTGFSGPAFCPGVFEM